MKNNKGNQTKKKYVSKAILTTLNIMIGISIVILAVMVLFTVSMLKEAGKYYYNYNSLNYQLRDGRYGRLTENTHENMAGEFHTDDRDYAEMYAVGRYAEARLLSNAYKNCGENDRATNWEEKAKAAEAQMGLFAPEKQKIDALYSIDK